MIPTTLVICALGARGDSPVHDRWWLTDSGGVRLGTSFGSLGGRRDSELSRLTNEAAQDLSQQFDDYASTRKKIQNAERLSYVTLSF
jgi:hypothetical protein